MHKTSQQQSVVPFEQQMSMKRFLTPSRQDSFGTLDDKISQLNAGLGIAGGLDKMAEEKPIKIMGMTNRKRNEQK